MNNILYPFGTGLLVGFLVGVLLLNRGLVKKIWYHNSGIEFFEQKRKMPKLKLAPVYSVDPVISSDGHIYRLHLTVWCLPTEELGISNWRFHIIGEGEYVFKQYFLQDATGFRRGLGKLPDLLGKPNESRIVGVEFEPEGEYRELIFAAKRYKARLSCSTSDGEHVVTFKFRVQERNLKNIAVEAKLAKSRKQPKVVSFPIV